MTPLAALELATLLHAAGVPITVNTDTPAMFGTTLNAELSLLATQFGLDVASIDTNEPKRDEHLRSADFFDAATHPKITFRSTRIEQKGSEVSITGDLAIRGTTKPVLLLGEFTEPVQDPWGNSRAGLAVSALARQRG